MTGGYRCKTVIGTSFVKDSFGSLGTPDSGRPSQLYFYIYCCVITGLGLSSLGHCILLDDAQMLVQNQAADVDKQDAANGLCPATREFSKQPTDHDA